jgi:hypothetical protein
MSVEAAAPVPWYEQIFSDQERAVARRRLVDHGFDIDAFRRSRESDSPGWTREG